MDWRTSGLTWSFWTRLAVADPALYAREAPTKRELVALHRQWKREQRERRQLLAASKLRPSARLALQAGATLRIASDGHVRAFIRHEGREVPFAHRVLELSGRPRPSPKHLAHHNENAVDTLDDRPESLEWVTQPEHSRIHGRMRTAKKGATR